MIKEKLKNILTADDVVTSINENIDFLIENIPQIEYMIGFDQRHPHHHLDLWNHTLYALSLSENDFEIRLCLLLHDISKPFVYVEGEVRHYPYHALISAKMSKIILKDLEFDEEFIEEVYDLIRLHDTKITSNDIVNNYGFYLKLYKIQYCDALSHNPSVLEKRKDYLSKTLKLLNG